MNKIVQKEQFSEKVFKLVVEAPLIAKARRAGHFVIVRVGEKGERIPLTIAESDPVRGTITLVVQTVGASTTKLCALQPGDYITDVVGPLGRATHIENFGTAGARLSNEESILVVNKDDSEGFFNDVFRLSELYNQDCFCYKAKGDDVGYNVGTNASDYPGYGNMEYDTAEECWYIETSNGNWEVLPDQYDTAGLWYME